MKYIVALVFAVFAMNFTADAQLVVDGENISAVITHNTTRVELSEMANAFRAEGVEMRYDNIEWASGHLIRIRVSMKGSQGEIVQYVAATFSEDQTLKVTRKMTEGIETVCAGLDCE
ncbi:MAG: hypothetical protein ACJAU0_002562 [Flavobacteriales bacterium]|jgi:hypothetical protein